MTRSSGSEPVVLVSLVRGDTSFQNLQRHLTQRGYRALLSDESAVEGRSAEDTASFLRGVDAVWVVHTLRHSPAEVNRDVDVASEVIASSRVGVLVETAVPLEAERLGYDRVRYREGRAEDAADELVAGLVSMGLHGQAGVKRRLAATQNSRFATGVVPPVLLLGMVLAGTALAVLTVLAGIRPGDQSTEAADAAEATSEPAGEAEAEAAAAAGQDPAGASASDPFAVVDQAPMIGGVAPGSDRSSSPVAGAGALGGGDQPPAAPGVRDGTALPDTCVLDLRKDMLFAQPTICTQGGMLSLEGPVGPWHNDVGQIIISEGVVGWLRYEDATADVTLSEGIHQLDVQRAAYGLDSLELTFTGEGQHIHILQAPERGSAELTLTFALGAS
jgi:hypothetical protein